MSCPCRMAESGREADIAEPTDQVHRLHMISGKHWIPVAILTAVCGSSAWALTNVTISYAANGAQCSPSPQWWAENLEELQTFHLITVGANNDLRWDGKHVSYAALRSKLDRIGRGRFAQAHQIGVSLDQGGNCELLQQVRAMMEHSLNCKAAMCRDGDLDTPPPPPSSRP